MLKKNNYSIVGHDIILIRKKKNNLILISLKIEIKKILNIEKEFFLFLVSSQVFLRFPPLIFFQIFTFF